MPCTSDRVHAVEQPFLAWPWIIGAIHPARSRIRAARPASSRRQPTRYSAPRPLISRYLFTTAAVIACGDTSSTVTPARRIRSSTA